MERETILKFEPPLLDYRI